LTFLEKCGIIKLNNLAMR